MEIRLDAGDREVVELLEPARRGGVLYPAGHQFAVVRRHPKSVVVLVGGTGERLMLPPSLVRRVRAKAAEPPVAGPTLAVLVAAGLVRPGGRVGRG